MKTIIEYSDKYSFVDFLYLLFLLGAIIIIIEKVYKWVKSYFLLLHEKMKSKENENRTVSENTVDIQALSNKIEDLANLVHRQYMHLEKKIDEQRERLDILDDGGRKRDSALLRDRIVQGMRFFSKNIGEDGFVHIKLTDYENLSHLFEEYFQCGGNGALKKMYEDEFKTWKIDR